MSYIGYGQLESLLSLYKAIKTFLESLNIELRMALDKEYLNNAEDIISTENFKKSIDNISSVNKNISNISDKTGNIAISYREKWEKENVNLKKEIRNEIIDVSLIVEKIDNAFNCLPKLQVDIVKMFYFEKLTWEEISKKLHFSKKQLQKRRTEALRKMIPMLRVETELFEKVINRIIKEVS